MDISIAVRTTGPNARPASGFLGAIGGTIPDGSEDFEIAATEVETTDQIHTVFAAGAEAISRLRRADVILAGDETEDPEHGQRII